MVLAIMELADEQSVELAREYEAAVSTFGISWESLESTRVLLWQALIHRAQQGEITIRGVRTPVEGAVTISPDALRGGKPNFLADTLEVAGATIYSVGVFESDPHTSTRSGSPKEIKGRGGRADKHDLVAFAAEVVRVAYLDGFDTRRTLTKHMLDWSAKHLDTEPDESWVRKLTAKLCPADVPAE